MAQGDALLNRLHKERTSLRRLFTKTVEKITDEGTAIEKGLLTILEDKFKRLTKIDDRIIELTPEEDMDKEIEKADSYRDTYFKTIEILKEKEKGQPSRSETLSINSETNFTLPKLKLEEFDLNPGTWQTFYSQFQKIHFDVNISNEVKFRYLCMSLKAGTVARKVVESYPISNSNYDKMWDHLKERFGADDRIIDFIIRELLALLNNKMSISELYDCLGSKIRSLESLGLTSDKYAVILYPLVESCLPSSLIVVWARFRHSGEILSLHEDRPGVESRPPSTELERLMEFLKMEVTNEEKVRNAAKFAKSQNVRTKEEGKEATAAALAIHSIGKTSCLFCDGEHSSYKCDKLDGISVTDRREKVKNKGVCYVCLKKGHRSQRCTSNVKCSCCKGRHYDIVCLKKANSALTLLTQKGESSIANKTAMIRISNGNKEEIVRAIFDDGSNRSYLDVDIARRLNCKPVKKEWLKHIVFGGSVSGEVEHELFKVHISGVSGGEKFELLALGQPKICGTLPRVDIGSIKRVLKERGITLSDNNTEDRGKPVQLLLGADILPKLMTGRIEVLNPDLMAIEYRVGWCLLGKVPNPINGGNIVADLNNVAFQALWELENLGIQDPLIVNNNDEIIDEFKRCLKINDEKRYEVALPWLQGHPCLDDNFKMAKSRLSSVTTRLLKNDLFAAYNDVICEWEANGIIEIVPSNEVGRVGHFLPHRPVVKMDKAKSKIRPVFDASAKNSQSVSLNECLSSGPNLVQEIIPLLIRFRKGKIGLTADIKQAFLMIAVRKEDRDCLRFLWYKDSNTDEVCIYRHCRVVFGLTCSPFLLNATIQHHLNENVYGDIATKLKRSFYVDDVITSLDSQEEAASFAEQANRIMMDAKFELRGWVWTGKVDAYEQMVLGMTWNVADDTLACVGLHADQNVSFTKRGLLSIVSKIYDPLGMLSPALVIPKLLLQDAFKRKLEWDAPLPEEIRQPFYSWLTDSMETLKDVKVPRWFIAENARNISLHAFCDASGKAYGCCLFVRSENETSVKVQFVCGKSKVAPIGDTTIPRLELLGACLAARMYNSIKANFNVDVPAYFWCDSQVVLAWLRRLVPWKNFVGNRVDEIQKLTNIKSWNYCRSEMNPADISSRGCSAKSLIERKWHEGPQWLYLSLDKWPSTDDNAVVTDEVLKEAKRGFVLTAQTIQYAEQEDDLKLGDRFSNYHKTVGLMSWMLRFIDRCRGNKVEHAALSRSDRERGEIALFKYLQKCYPPQKDNNLCLLEGEDGLLRVRTKVAGENYTETFKTPIVLKPCQVVETMVRGKHLKLHHAGVNTILAQLRNEGIWLVKGRRIARKVVNRCIRCKRFNSQAVITPQPILPNDRVKMGKVFEVTGVDLYGPLFLKNGSKVWGVLFTCATYRCVRLDLTESLSTEDFILTLRRMIARNGRISTIISDNGTNFHGLHNLLKDVDYSRVENDSRLNLKWKFNVPTGSWWGGFFERMIGLVKQLLRRSLGNARLTLLELTTVLLEVESVINSRPITYMSDRLDEVEPITPSMFLQEETNIEVGDLDAINSETLTRRLKYIKGVKDIAKRRFRAEYLGALASFNVKTKGKVELGDIVLIGEDNKKRLKWELGRVVELFVGKDNVGRVAKLKTEKGELIRPVQRLHKLECSTLRGDSEGLPVEEEMPSSLSQEEAKQDGESRLETRVGRRVRRPERLNL